MTLRRCSTVRRSSLAEAVPPGRVGAAQPGAAAGVGEPDRKASRPGDGRGAVAAAAVDDVLPDQHAEPVAVGVPPQRLDLEVLAQHREAEPLHRLDVVHHRRVRRRGHQPVRPVALVEHADVQVRARRSAAAAGCPVSSGPTPNERIRDVRRHAVGPERDLHVVEVRVLGASTGGRRRRDRDAGRLTDLAPRSSSPATRDRRGARPRRARSTSTDAVVEVRHQVSRSTCTAGTASSPHGLPDARLRGVPDAAARQPLLAGARAAARPGGRARRR